MASSTLVPPPLRESDLQAQDSPLPRTRARWLGHPMVRLAAMVLGTAVLALLAVGLISALPGDPSTALVVWTQLAVVITAYLLLTVVLERRRPPLELDPRRALGLPIGLAVGAALFLLCFGVIAVLGGYRFAGTDAGYQWAVPWLVVGLGAGVTEEVLFRGVLFRLFEQWLGTWLAAGSTGVYFGLLHLTNPNATVWGAVAITLEAGFMFAVLYALTRSLWLVIGVHIAWNVMQGPVLGIQVSGSGFTGGWLRTETVGPDWLTGGTFGAEASVVTVVLLVAFTGLLVMLLVRSGQVVAPSWTRRRQLSATEARTPRPDPR